MSVNMMTISLSFLLRIRQNGVFTIEEDTTAEIRGTKRDGNGYSAAATIDSTVAPKTVTVEGATQMTAIAGKNPFEIVFTKNGKVVSMENNK